MKRLLAMLAAMTLLCAAAVAEEDGFVEVDLGILTLTVPEEAYIKTYPRTDGATIAMILPGGLHAAPAPVTDSLVATWISDPFFSMNALASEAFSQLALKLAVAKLAAQGIATDNVELLDTGCDQLGDIPYFYLYYGFDATYPLTNQPFPVRIVECDFMPEGDGLYSLILTSGSVEGLEAMLDYFDSF